MFLAILFLGVNSSIRIAVPMPRGNVIKLHIEQTHNVPMSAGHNPAFSGSGSGDPVSSVQLSVGTPAVRMDPSKNTRIKTEAEAVTIHIRRKRMSFLIRASVVSSCEFSNKAFDFRPAGSDSSACATRSLVGLDFSRSDSSESLNRRSPDTFCECDCRQS